MRFPSVSIWPEIDDSARCPCLSGAVYGECCGPYHRGAGMRWYRLDIVRTSRGGLLDVAGTVEFRAKYRLGSGAGEQHENSRFTREDRRWYYVDAA
jgi:SEC-C motif-containing protein